jgi:hypothetical protein
MYKNSYIKIGQYNRIAHMNFNGSLSDEIDDRRDYVAKLRKVTAINLTNSCHHYIFTGDHVMRMNLLLKNACEMNFEFAVVWFEGTWPMNSDFEDELLDVIDNNWSQTEWLAAGHILNRNPDNDAPKFHQQCVVINLSTWNGIGQPDLLSDWNKPFPCYIASADHIHDNYTPMFLRPDNGVLSDDVNVCHERLQSVIPIALANGKMIHNLPHNVREHKHCCYPEDDIEDTEKWLLDLNWDKQDESFLAEYAMSKVPEDKRELYGLKVMKSFVMYITNTESIPGFEDNDYEIMTAPCSGLHQFKHMTNARNSLRRVVWSDFSEAGLWWTKNLLENWDGKDFHAFYLKNKPYLEKHYVAHHAANYDRKLAEKFVTHYGDEKTWLDHWDWIRTLDHTFMLVDLVNEWDKVIAEIGVDQKVFLQVSNIWQYETNYLNTPHHQAQASFINLINELLKTNKEVYLSGDSPSGVFYNYQNMKDVISII